MIINEIPIHIRESPYSNLEQFTRVAEDVEFGTKGTVRLQTFSFLDGEAVYLDLNGTKVRRDAGFQKVLSFGKQNQDSRNYVFRCGQWYQQTTSPEQTLTSLQRHVGQSGFWIGFYDWCLEAGDLLARLLSLVATPVIVVPVLLLKALEHLLGFGAVLLVCLFVWRVLIDGIASLVLGPA